MPPSHAVPATTIGGSASMLGGQRQAPNATPSTRLTSGPTPAMRASAPGVPGLTPQLRDARPAATA